MADTTSSPELDPFAFPSETRGRFRMLIAASFALAWSLGSYFIAVPNLYTLAFRMDPQAQESIDKVREQGTFVDVSREEILRVAQSQAGRDFFQAMIYQAVRLPLSIFLVLLLVGGTAFLYFRHPAHLRRRYRTRPLTPEEAPTVVSELRRFLDRAGLSPTLRFESRPGVFDGLAFGRRDQEVVVLSGHPKLLERSWCDVTRAIALHELGHVANDDIRNREITRALWRALLFFVILSGLGLAAVWLLTGELRVPVLDVSPSSSGGLAPIWQLFVPAGRTAAILLVMGWIWAELIRVREFYADWRVASWGLREGLLRRLQLPASHLPAWEGWRLWRTLRQRYGRRRWWQRCARWLRWLWEHGWRHHPSNERRIEVIEEPASLFRATPHLSFLTGLLLSVLFGQLGSFFNDLVFWTALISTPFFFLIGPLALVSYPAVAVVVTLAITRLVSGALGVQVQREATFDLATGRHSDWGYLRLVRPALCFALGIEAGLLLTPWGALAERSPFGALAWLAGFTGMLWIWFIYVRAMSRLVLGSRVGPRVPIRSQRVLAWVATFLLGALLWPVLTARVAIHVAADRQLLLSLTPAGKSPQDQLVYVFVMTSIVLVVLALLFYLMVGAASLLGSGLMVCLRHPRCKSCGESSPPGLVVGRRCSGCGTPLSGWVHLRDGSPGLGADR